MRRYSLSFVLIFIHFLCSAQQDTIHTIIPTGHAVGISQITVSPDNKYLLSTAVDGNTIIWDIASALPLWDFTSNVRSNTGIFSPDGKRVLTGGSAPSGIGVIAILWDIETKKKLVEFRSEKAYATVICFSRDGKQIATGGVNGLVQVWDVETGKLKKAIETDGWVKSISFSNDGTQLLLAHKTCEIREIATGEPVKTLADPNESSYCTAACYSPDGKFVLAVRGKNTTLWNVSNEQFVRRWSGHAEEVVSIDYAPGNKLIITGSADGTAKVWNPATGDLVYNISSEIPLDEPIKEVHKLFDGASGQVRAVCFSPDAKKFFIGLGNGLIKMYEVASGKEIMTFTGKSTRLEYLFVTPDNKQIFFRSPATKSIKLFEISTGQVTSPVVAAEPAFEKIIKLPGTKPTLYIADRAGMRVIDSKTDKTIGKFYLLGDKDWYYINYADKTFDGSPGAFSIVFYLRGLTISPLNPAKTAAYRPGSFKKMFYE